MRWVSMGNSGMNKKLHQLQMYDTLTYIRETSTMQCAQSDFNAKAGKMEASKSRDIRKTFPPRVTIP